ncbi:protein phosphatase inhibitor 2-like [Microplitis mediator]|uniref:protein phosphatase inhibitor 2-like n=1 Tax=Microplitis mediator TaxID=375433 RepID=UPI002557C3C0|nr:protein phosphatase inhibitor 2-like [Microplitis mediator]
MLKMAENLGKRPSKGILKTSTSFENQDAPRPNKETKWDEMNIIATLHPPEKDYGHMKIEEPKTPYNYEGYSNKHDADELDSSAVSEKLARSIKPKIFEESSSDDEEETPEEREKRKAFEAKRRGHYREWEAVKIARNLIQEDEEDDDDDDDDDDGGGDANNDDKDNGSELEFNESTGPKCVALSGDSENKSESNSPE